MNNPSSAHLTWSSPMRCTATLAGLLIMVSACAGPDAVAVNQVPEPIAEEVAWADKVCGLTVHASRIMKAKPELDGVDDAAARKRVSEWLGLSIQAVEKTMKDLEPLKTGPNAKAEKVTADVISAFGGFKNSLEESRKAVDEANRTDTSSTTDAFTKATAIEGPTDEFTQVVRISAFGDAAKRAKNCARTEHPSALTSSS